MIEKNLVTPLNSNGMTNKSQTGDTGTVKVIDSIMGSGKTSWAIQFMNNAPAEQKFLYVTPILSEVDRIIKACINKSFVQPKESNRMGRFQNKSENFIELLSKGKNIATTHELFRRITPEALQHIQGEGYSLILDEVFQVIDEEKVKQKKIDGFLEREFLKVSNDPKKIGDIKLSYLKSGKEDRFDEFYELQALAENNRLVLVEANGNISNGGKNKSNKKILMWLFPNDVFKYFKKVYNLTYLFDGSLQKAYFDVFNIQYTKHSIKKDPNSADYSLIKYDPLNDIAIKNSLKPQIKIYDGSLNGIGSPVKGNNPLSKTWFRNSSFTDRAAKNRYNYFHNEVNATKNDVMWATFKRNQAAISKGRFTAGNVPINIRSTNEYRYRYNLAFCANIFINPNIVSFFKLNGVNVKNDEYALSMLLQWIFRSRIRDHKDINIYVPSERMRTLLKNW